MLSFDKLAKQVAFDDQKSCFAESDRSINDSRFNHNKPNLSIIVLKTRKEIEEYLYPRIDYFHKNRSQNIKSVSSKNRFKNDPQLFANSRLPIYIYDDKEATINTIDYVFKEFHRGVFVQIMNNKIKTFVAIDNYESVGFDISKHLKFDKSKYKDLEDFVRQANEKHFQKERLIKRKEDSIYFTDCSINLWEPGRAIRERTIDWLYTSQFHLLTELLNERKINDIEFMLNSRDQTMLVRDGESSPHLNILGNLTTPLRRKHKKYIPILNFGTHKKYADIPMPTNDDWEIITNKIFLGVCRSTYLNISKSINTDYDSKIPTAIFRGGATGCGTVIKNNQRLHAAFLTNKFYKHPKYGVDSKDGLYLDARLVSYKVKPKKHYSEKYITIIDPKSLPMRLSKPIPLGTISNHKYVLSIEGNIAQFRLSLELSYNSVILLVKSEFYIWYQPLLKPWIHFVPIKSDLSDLMQKIHWCRTNDDKCRTIASNARAFYEMYINRESVFDYMECIFNKM